MAFNGVPAEGPWNWGLAPQGTLAIEGTGPSFIRTAGQPVVAAVDARRAAAEFAAGNTCYSNHDFQGALTHYNAAAQFDPSAADHHCGVGAALLCIGQAEPALAHLERALSVDPNHVLAHETLGHAHATLGHRAESLRHMRRAAELAPDNLDIALSLATVLESNRETDEAWQIVQRMLAAGYEGMRLAAIFARIAPHVHREQDAMTLIGRVLTKRDFNHPMEEASLCFVASQLLDRMRRYDEAFALARRGHQLTGVHSDPRHLEGVVNELIAYFNKAKLRSLPRATNGCAKPVFIVGMPRSGSTLVEQILASHPSIHGAGELMWLVRIIDRVIRHPSTGPVNMPRCLDWLSCRDLNELAASYLGPLNALAPSADLICDKQLFNFLNLGLISVLFPEARVIHCRRHPLDTCVSCYMTQFASGHEFCHDLRTLGHYYRQYERLMAHWKQELELPIFEVNYEEVVADMEGQSRQILNFLGVPWDAQVLRFNEHERLVATASNEQVRRPIYNSSVNRWRNYDKHLGPLRAALGWG